MNIFQKIFNLFKRKHPEPDLPEWIEIMNDLGLWTTVSQEDKPC